MMIKEEKEPLFERRKIKAIAEGKTPKKEEAREEIARQLNTQKELVFVKKIKQEYGMRRSKIEALVYENIEAASRFERKKEKKEASK